jgi:formate dehydrogenase assembly factor FdhD
VVVQTFAGTIHNIHHPGLSLLVTNSNPTAQAREMARRCQIELVDRQALGRWASTKVFRLDR